MAFNIFYIYLYATICVGMVVVVCLVTELEHVMIAEQ
jgi:hypothetical protein